ncbi:hypothetical protein ACMU_10350 [Actibacterium mucosum KCTC 23349]|uniref:Uncharacterized protein n=1 Tax=Actibacterium mucosum KCTC 23349 TaxID=1454373 RepID=A0A037ZMT3_9RHOB|nr:hypothetical protein [Actibacterium mucosum]KAJ56146.1 hypothetical protein ACMU_10350 [Actibacterium mucosum KCTC 23349]
MAKLKVPSIQHLARNWDPQSGVISRDLVRLVRNPPRFTYRPVYSATSDLLQFGVSLDQIETGIRNKEKREHVRDNYLELLGLIQSHFRDCKPDFVNPVSTRVYPIGSGLDVPFTPPLIYGVGGQLRFPWFSFWKTNPLKDMNLRLFVTIVDEILRDDPDLEDCIFEILDFSAPKGSNERSLVVTNAAEIEPLSQRDKTEMLETFVDGYVKAKAILEAEPAESPRDEKRDADRDYDDDQPSLFD